MAHLKAIYCYYVLCVVICIGTAQPFEIEKPRSRQKVPSVVGALDEYDMQINTGLMIAGVVSFGLALCAWIMYCIVRIGCFSKYITEEDVHGGQIDMLDDIIDLDLSSSFDFSTDNEWTIT
eukprot:328643_1